MSKHCSDPQGRWYNPAVHTATGTRRPHDDIWDIDFGACGAFACMGPYFFQRLRRLWMHGYPFFGACGANACMGSNFLAPAAPLHAGVTDFSRRLRRRYLHEYLIFSSPTATLDARHRPRQKSLSKINDFPQSINNLPSLINIFLW